VPAKKAKKSPRSLRYLLYADRRLQRISVRRISERLKKAKQSRRSMRRKNSAGAGSPAHFSWASSRTMALGVIGVVAAAALITASQPAPRSDVARGDVPEANAPLENELVPAAPRPRASRSRTTDIPMPTTNAAKVPAVESPAKPRVVETAKPRVVEPALKIAAVDSKAQGGVKYSPSATITGCLELDEGTFWLRNASGADVPKSRSWRSGFLKKGSSSVELVDAANTLKLPNYVGQRVAATGMLANREMLARSLRRVAASCS